MNKLLTGILLLSILYSCKKKNTINQQDLDFFPPVNVDFTVNLSLPNYAGLNFPNGHAYEDNFGYKGVVIYNTGFDGPEQFVAFDRTCPYKPDSICSRVSVDSTNIYFACGQLYQGRFVKCCSSRFFALNGTWIDGPAKRNLRQYFVYRFGSNILRITNVPR
ncbi:MAG: hypothetical protein ACK4K9_08960 [Bacteroidia bacterium]